MIVIKLLAAIFAGWICGVIINYLSDTLPENRRFRFPYCSECKHDVTILDYISGRSCRICGSPRKIRFWLVNSGSILLIVYLLLFSRGMPNSLVVDIVALLFLLLITIIDIEHHLVLHVISLAGVILFGIIGVISHGSLQTALGGLAGFGIMLLFYLLGRAYSGYVAHKRGVEIDEGMGFGDVNLGGVCGLLLGWPGIVGGIFIGVILGGIWSMVLIFRSMLMKKKNPLQEYIAYAPFITIATAVLWLIR